MMQYVRLYCWRICIRIGVPLCGPCVPEQSFFCPGANSCSASFYICCHDALCPAILLGFLSQLSASFLETTAKFKRAPYIGEFCSSRHPCVNILPALSRRRSTFASVLVLQRAIVRLLLQLRVATFCWALCVLALKVKCSRVTVTECVHRGNSPCRN
jgi:hypothetical protein